MIDVRLNLTSAASTTVGDLRALVNLCAGLDKDASAYVELDEHLQPMALVITDVTPPRILRD